MSTSSVQPPYEIFTDIDGQPLEDGYIWIGTAGLPAISNPITVYWNAALTIPAVQPIRTIGGYPMNSGTPAVLYVSASDYSILVQNKNGSSIYSSLNATERYSSALVTFLQAGANAVQRTAQSKMRDIVSVKDFGAVGDGVTNDTAAIQAAFNYAQSLASSGQMTGCTVFFPPGVFYVTATLTINTGKVGILGSGRFTTTLKRNTNYGDTLFIQSSFPGTAIEQISIEKIAFIHDISGGVAMSGWHIIMHDVHQGKIDNVFIKYGQFGIGVIGGTDTSLNQVLMFGASGAAPGENSQIGLLLAAGANPSVPRPTQLRGKSVRILGDTLKGYDVGLKITAAEDCSFDHCYFGNAKFHQVLIMQTGGVFISDCTFGPGCYFDGSGSYSVLMSGTDGDGSIYIGNTKFIGCNFMGQNGDGNTGLFVDGTARAGTYPQTVHGLIVDSCSFSYFNNTGVIINGGKNIAINNCQIGGNNFLNTTGGNGLQIGAACDGVTISNNRIGRDAAWRDSALAYQLHGIVAASGATNVTICNNDLRYNVTAGLVDNLGDAATSRKLIVNNQNFNESRIAVSPAMPASTVGRVNPYGSPAWVSIYSGTVSDIKMNGTTVASSTAGGPVMFLVGAGNTVTITYSSAPSWVWWPQ